MSFLEVFILSFIEGVTEFLPVSSTGHLIITQHFLGLGENDFVTQFNIMIQFGAILSVLVIYWRRFLPHWPFYLKVFVGFLPAALIGLILKNKIDNLLHSVTIVAWALIIGGGILILIDKINKNHKTLEELNLKESFKIGLFQCLAFIPGVSRSAASILGGMILGLSRKEAAEFSFFLAVPTIAGATFIKALKVAPHIQSDNVFIILSGMSLSFLFALIAIKYFIKLISQYGFFWFGIYRIIIGTLILYQFH